MNPWSACTTRQELRDSNEVRRSGCVSPLGVCGWLSLPVLEEIMASPQSPRMSWTCTPSQTNQRGQLESNQVWTDHLYAMLWSWAQTDSKVWFRRRPVMAGCLTCTRGYLLTSRMLETSYKGSQCFGYWRKAGLKNFMLSIPSKLLFNSIFKYGTYLQGIR